MKGDNPFVFNKVNVELTITIIYVIKMISIYSCFFLLINNLWHFKFCNFPSPYCTQVLKCMTDYFFYKTTHHTYYTFNSPVQVFERFKNYWIISSVVNRQSNFMILLVHKIHSSRLLYVIPLCNKYIPHQHGALTVQQSTYI